MIIDIRIIFIEGKKMKNVKKYNLKFIGYRIYYRLEKWYDNNGFWFIKKRIKLSVYKYYLNFLKEYLIYRKCLFSIFKYCGILLIFYNVYFCYK